MALSASMIVTVLAVYVTRPFSVSPDGVSVANSLPSTSVSLVGENVSDASVVSFPDPAAKIKLPKAPNVASPASVPAAAAALSDTVKAFSSVAPSVVVSRTVMPCGPRLPRPSAPHPRSPWRCPRP